MVGRGDSAKEGIKENPWTSIKGLQNEVAPRRGLDGQTRQLHESFVKLTGQAYLAVGRVGRA